MNVLLQTALSNALAAGFLALVVLAMTRFWTSAALRHGLWLLVLAKLISPPLFVVPISLTWPQPASAPMDEPFAPASEPIASASSQSDPEADGNEPDEAEQLKIVDDRPNLSDRMTSASFPAPLPPENFEGEGFVEAEPVEPMVLSQRPASISQESEGLTPSEKATSSGIESVPPTAGGPAEKRITERRFSVEIVVFAVWLAGTLGWFLLAATRILRFHRLLRFTEPAPWDLQSEAVRLASRLGLKSCPPVNVVNGPISPLLWAFCGRARILLPAALLDRLSPSARETLLLHELAHYRRRDHWVRVLELIATGLYWWNPVVWWAVREIHRAEEECCDGWVVSQSPENKSTYARALLETIEFLAASRSRLPPIASGIGRAQILERRLRGILMDSISQRLSLRGRLFLFALAFGCLPLLPWLTMGVGQAAEPAASESAEDKTAPTPPEPPDAKEAAASQRILSFEGRLFSEPTEFETTSVPLQFAEQEVRSLAISKDGKRMVVGHGRWTTPGLVRFWNLETQKPLASWKRPRGVSGVAISPNGRLIAAAGWDRLVIFYDTQTFEEVRRIGPQANVARIAFSPDGKTLATATESAELKLWDVETGKEKRSFGGDLFRMQSVCFSHDGKLLAAGGGAFGGERFGRVAIWDVDTGGQVCVLNGHTEPVIGVAFSPDGKTLASAAWDNTLKFWEVPKGKEIRTIPTPSRLESVQYSPDGKLVVTTSYENAARIWNPETGELVATLPHEEMTIFAVFTPDGKQVVSGGAGKVVRLWEVSTAKQTAVLTPQIGRDEPSAVLALAYSPDGRWIASAHDDQTVRIREADSGQVLRVLKGHEDLVSFIAFSPDGGSLATAGYDRLVKLWDAKTGKELRTCTGHENWIFSVAFSPDGKTLASGSYDKTVRIWNAATGKEQTSLEGHTAAVRSVAFSPDGAHLASASSDKTIRLWDLQTGKEHAALKGHGGAVRAIGFSPDGDQLASASEDKTVKLWDINTRKEQFTLSGHEGMVWCLAYSPGGKTLASAGFDNTIKLWNPETGTERLTLKGHADVVTALAFAPDMSSLLSSSYDASIRQWKSKGRGLRPVAIIDQLTATTAMLAFSPDGRILVTGGGDKMVWLWDLHTGQVRHKLEGHEHAILRGAISPDGKMLATGDRVNTIRLWNMETGKHLGTLSGHSHWITSLAFAPEGELLASGSRDGTVKFWNVRTKTVVKELPGQPLWVLGVAFSPDGKTLATSTGSWESQDQGQVKLWDVESGKEQATLTGPKTAIGPVKFSPDGRHIAAPGWDGTIWIWDATTREERNVLRSSSGVVRIAFHPDGETMSAGDFDGNITIWDLKTSLPHISFKGHTSHAQALACSPDGSVLVSAGHDVTIRFWPLTRSPQLRQLRAAGPWTHAVAFHPDGKQFLASRGPGNSAQLLDRETGREIRRFEGHTRPISALAISADGQRLVTGGQDLTVRVWDMETGKELKQFSGDHKEEVRSVAFSPDGRYLLSGSLDKKTHVWDLETGKLLRTRDGEGMSGCSEFLDNSLAIICDSRDAVIWNVETGEEVRRFGHAQPIVCLTISPDRKRLLTGTRGNTMRLWDLKTGKSLRRFDAHEQMVRCVAFTPDGRRALSGSYDQTIIFWDLEKGKILGRLSGHERHILNVKISPDGRFALSGAADYTVRLWDLASVLENQGTTAAHLGSWLPKGLLPTMKLTHLGDVESHEKGAWFARYSPDGKIVATGGGDNLIRLWDASSRKKLGELTGHEGSVRCGEFSPDGNWLATGGADTTVKIWDVKKRELAATLTGHRANIRAVSFSADSKSLASGGEDKTVYVWDVAGQKERFRIELDHVVYCVAFSPDGRWLATGSGDHLTKTPGELRIWNAADGGLVQTMSDSQAVIAGLTFSPDGKRIASRDRNLAPSVWDVESGRKLMTNPRIMGVRSFAFSPDGKQLAIGNSAHKGFLWILDSTTGHLMAEQKGHGGLIFSITYSPDGKTLASASEDGTVKFWKLEDH